MRRILPSATVLVSALLLLPETASAQAAIAGVVKDPSGAALPGVTVEAASPALIEKVRTVTTDSAGQYRILDLRPGTYDVTFTMSGFKTMRRDRHPARGQLHRAGQRRPRSLARSKKPSPSPANRRSSTSSATGRRWSSIATCSTRFPTAHAQPAGARQPDSGHDRDGRRLGADRDDGVRLAARRSGRDGRRHAHQPARRRRGSSAASI